MSALKHPSDPWDTRIINYRIVLDSPPLPAAVDLRAFALPVYIKGVL